MAKESSYLKSTKYSVAELTRRYENSMKRRKVVKRSDIMKADDSEAKRIYTGLSKQVNSRILKFERADISSSAVRYMKTLIAQYFGEGVSRVRAGSSLSMDELRDLSLEMAKFINKPTSNIYGELLSQKRREATFADRISGFADLNTGERDRIFNFLSDTTVQGLLSYTGKKGSATSEKIVEAIEDIISGEDTMTVGELNSMLYKYEKGIIGINDVWEELGFI